MSLVTNYIRFSSENPRFDFTFLYPVDWQALETKGKETDYDEVFILGPRNQEDTYSLGLRVLVKPAREEGGQYTNLEEVVVDYLSKHKRLTKYREISRSHGNLAGVEATEIEVGYTMPLPLNTINPKETPILERRIFLKKGDHFYEVIYTAAEEDYYGYLETFRDVVRTFEFRDGITRRVYRPLILPAPVQAIRESSTEYEADEGE
jgi:hypothetical protein